GDWSSDGERTAVKIQRAGSLIIKNLAREHQTSAAQSACALAAAVITEKHGGEAGCAPRLSERADPRAADDEGILAADERAAGQIVSAARSVLADFQPI